MIEHSKEPWYTGDPKRHFERIIFSQDKHEFHPGVDLDIAEARLQTSFQHADKATANARRIVACVNACAGLKTEDLEQYTTGELVNCHNCKLPIKAGQAYGVSGLVRWHLQHWECGAFVDRRKQAVSEEFNGT